MSLTTGRMATQHRHSRFGMTPPPWVREWTGSDVRHHPAGGAELTVTQGCAASLIAVRIPGAAALEADQFERQTVEAYTTIRSAIGGLPHQHPVRFWNYLPAIHESMGDGLDRYMVFNRGRFTALCDWFGGSDSLSARLPAASGVGHDGDELIVHCLAMKRPGEAVENPRQVPPVHYSARYGPLPPCFARATRVMDPRDGTTALLIAGTASIRGEQSVHVDDLRSQLDETFRNLRALIDPRSAAASTEPLAALTDVRVYYVHERDREPIEAYCRAALGSAATLEVIRTDLCRPELLVEIEGLAKNPELHHP